MVSLRLALPLSAAILIGCGGGESGSPGDQSSRQADAADRLPATSTPTPDTAADGQAASLGPGTAKVDGSLVENAKRDSQAAARAVVEAEQTVRRCAGIATGHADPLELSDCKTDVTMTGALNAVNALLADLSKIAPNLSWIFLGRTDTGQCGRAARSESRVGIRHSQLLDRMTLIEYAQRGRWPSLAARNTKLTEKHSEALRRLRSACRL